MVSVPQWNWNIARCTSYTRRRMTIAKFVCQRFRFSFRTLKFHWPWSSVASHIIAKGRILNAITFDPAGSLDVGQAFLTMKVRWKGWSGAARNHEIGDSWIGKSATYYLSKEMLIPFRPPVLMLLTSYVKKTANKLHWWFSTVNGGIVSFVANLMINNKAVRSSKFSSCKAKLAYQLSVNLWD